MQLNFSLKRAWTDLFSEKKYVWQLLSVMAIYICLELLGNICGLKGPKFLGSIIIGGYLSLLGYNIINSKDKVLENIFNNSETNKFILLVGLKIALIESLFLLCLYIPVIILGVILGVTKILVLNPMQFTVLFMVLLSPVIFFITIFPPTMFSATLNFNQNKTRPFERFL